MWFFRSGPVVPVLRFAGPIGMVTPLRPGISMSQCAGAIEKAFQMSKLPSVAVLINSPGGSPVQSSLIYKRIRSLAEEKGLPVYAFAEDVAASGGYMIACAADEIYADESSILGSIGVVSAGFGFTGLIEKLGVERRVHTAGESKAMLDPFQPEKPEDVKRLKTLQKDVHAMFVELVKSRRGVVLKGSDKLLFSGEFWSGAKAVELGLADRLGDLKGVLKERFGDKVRLVPIPTARGGLLRRLRPLSSLDAPLLPFADDLVSAVETRALWSRFGL